MGRHARLREPEEGGNILLLSSFRRPTLHTVFSCFFGNVYLTHQHKGEWWRLTNKYLALHQSQIDWINFPCLRDTVCSLNMPVWASASITRKHFPEWRRRKRGEMRTYMLMLLRQRAAIFSNGLRYCPFWIKRLFGKKMTERLNPFWPKVIRRRHRLFLFHDTKLILYLLPAAGQWVWPSSCAFSLHLTQFLGWRIWNRPP